ncbi:DoxX family protein [Paenibacillus hamazuiensis]|uniref:DoxX family protein n=1 Tax=Paenibacillus hamazuiensis TaxID=2936508 RepID=UPI00200E0FE9|nr:DoxX family protein [Paenibacillus hamazuiensis]
MTKQISKGRLWTARILSGIAILFMLFDSIFKLMKPAAVVEGTVTLGFAEHHIVPIGIIGLICTILYAIPRTSVLGALLLTAYFGGAVASQVRMDAPLFSNILFAVYLAVFVWGGLWLRDERVRNLIPFQNKGANL